MTTYKVTAATGFDGHQEGEEFEADLEPFLEDHALKQGEIEIVKGSRKTKEVKDDG
jgi:hypothetical protein